ncbi:MAG TPA: hypothetical protein VEL76_42795, partial [Gemmataceae bacterium]|nr:hypothetical protein [Gemmataceae bacterium]
MTRKNWWRKGAGKAKRETGPSEKRRSGASWGWRSLEHKPFLEELEPRLAPAANLAYPAIDPFSSDLALVAGPYVGEDLPQFVVKETGTVLAATGLDTRALSGPGADSVAGQVVFLELGGAQDVRYDGPVSLSGFDVPAFGAPGQLQGQEPAVVAALVASLEQAFAGTGVRFTTTKPTGGDYSTVYVGGDDSAFAAYGHYLGLAEKVDTGNLDRRDEALVFSDLLPSSGLTAAGYGETLAFYVAHETGHLLGLEHTEEHDHAHDDPADPLAGIAFRPYTHIAIGKDVRDDVIRDGKVTINGSEYDVHPKVVEALQKYPSHYYAGAVAGDGFPDVVYGQAILHPVDMGVWMQRLLDMAWAAQTDPAWTAVERSQILAFSYGFLTHSAGDAFSHMLVREFEEGPLTPVQNVRHNLVEAYIDEATAGSDSNFARTLLPDGDVSDDFTHGITFEVPV